MKRRRPFTRAERIGGLMREEVGRIIAYELRSGLARYVEVTGTRLSGDLGHLKVSWVLRDGGDANPAQMMLEKAASYVGRVLRDTFQMRKTPKVVFYFDKEHERLRNVRKLLDDDRVDESGNEAAAAGLPDSDKAENTAF